MFENDLKFLEISLSDRVHTPNIHNNSYNNLLPLITRNGHFLIFKNHPKR